MPRARVIPVCRALLDRFPVTDIDIQEVSVEDVIRNIFLRADNPNANGGTTFTFNRAA